MPAAKVCVIVVSKVWKSGVLKTRGSGRRRPGQLPSRVGGLGEAGELLLGGVDAVCEQPEELVLGGHREVVPLVLDPFQHVEDLLAGGRELRERVPSLSLEAASAWAWSEASLAWSA
jgi:hypothetical protein